MIEAKFDQNDLQRIFAKLHRVSPQNRGGVLYRAFLNASLLVEGALRKNATTKILHRRTGRLAGSIESKVKQAQNTVEAVIGSGVRSGERMVYAEIHETGGIIRPKNGKYLVIPIRAGSPEAGGGGKPIASSSKITGFRRVTQVMIPARKYMSRTVEEKQAHITRILITEIDRGLAQ